MKVVLAVFVSVLIITGSVALGWAIRDSSVISSLTPNPTPVLTPLDVYSFVNLPKTAIPSGNISIIKSLKEEEKYNSYLINFEHNPNLEGQTMQNTTGLLNIPNEVGKYPLIVMLRGYVDQELYSTGVGTKNAGNYFANNGFITIAPDFLGYADSDENSADIFESRFQTYTTTLTLLQSIEEGAFPNEVKSKWDGENIFIWGHSNGGQIAITVLEISGRNYPTALWAPVTKPFPYSILYYTDESDDRGKFIRKELAKFENLYDVDFYSLENYTDNIRPPLLIHQGTADDAVPFAWTDTFVKTLRAKDKEVEYIKHPGADHNMRPVWDDVVKQDLEFFNSFLDSDRQ